MNAKKNNDNEISLKKSLQLKKYIRTNSSPFKTDIPLSLFLHGIWKIAISKKYFSSATLGL